MRRLLLLLLLFMAACDPAPPPATPVAPVTTPATPTAGPATPASGPTAIRPTPAASAPTTEAPALPLSPAIADWIRQNAVPFRTAEADEDFSDLEPLKQIIGQARIVALGEASHGTHEFFAMKRRILEFLVQEMGFSSLAMEMNGPNAAAINTYVQTGQGAPSSYLSWPWNTREVLGMVKWMHTHNEQAGSGPTISFQGFDIQAPGGEMDKVVTYVQKVDTPTAADQIEQLYTCFRLYQVSVYNYATATAQVRAECHDSVTKVYDTLNRQQVAYEAKSSTQAFAQALHSARLVVQAEDAYTTQDPIQSSTARDHYMAENVAWLLQQAGPDAKIVLWAHNEHVGTAPNGDIQSMGQDLRSRFGAAMVVFGFDFYSGSFNAYALSGESSIGPLGIHQADTPPAGSYESYLHSAGLPRLILDLRGVPPSPATDWLTGPRRFRRITAVYDDSHPEYSYTLTSLPQKFDAVIYFQDTTPSQP